MSGNSADPAPDDLGNNKCDLSFIIGNSTATSFSGTMKAATDLYDTSLETGLAALDNGEFVVLWDSWIDNDRHKDIFAQRVYNDGTLNSGSWMFNHTNANSQQIPTAANLGDGHFLGVWQSDGQDGNGYAIVGLAD